MEALVVDVPTLRSILGILQDSAFPPDQSVAGWITKTYFDSPLADEKTLNVQRQDFTALYGAYKRVRDLTNKTQEKWPFFRENGKAIGRGEAKAMTVATPEAGPQIGVVPEFVKKEPRVLQDFPPLCAGVTAAPVLEATPEPKAVAPILSPGKASSTSRRTLLAVESESVITNLDLHPLSRGSRATPLSAASKRNKRKVDLNENSPDAHPLRKRVKKETPTPAPSRRSSRNKPSKESPEPLTVSQLGVANKAKESRLIRAEAGHEVSVAEVAPIPPTQPQPDVKHTISLQTTPDPTSEIALPTLELVPETSRGNTSKKFQKCDPKGSRAAAPSANREDEIVSTSSDLEISENEGVGKNSYTVGHSTIDIVTLARIQTAEGPVSIELGPGTWDGSPDLILEYLSWSKTKDDAVSFEVFCNIMQYAQRKASEVPT